MAIKKKLSEKTDKRYRAKITVGHDADGKPIVKYASGRTKKELEEAKEELRKTYLGGTEVNRLVLYGEYLCAWYETSKRPSLRESGRQAYASIMNRHILPAFGHRQMRAITAADLQRFMNSKAAMKPTSVGCMHSILTNTFRAAYAEGIIDRDPSASLKKNSAKKDNRRALTEAECAAALKVGREHPDGLLLLLLYYTGMRIGEVLGLQWGDIDFSENVIHVRRDVDFKTNSLGDVKTDCSLRTIPMPPELAAVLRPLRGVPSVHILQSPKTHSFIGKSTYVRTWNRLAKAMYEADPTIESVDNTSVLTAHYFRHNYASVLYNTGVDVLSAQRFLGHSDPSTTLRIYTHLADKKAAAQADEVRSAFGNFLATFKQKPTALL